MNCSTCQENRSKYFTGKLPEDMKNSIQEHLANCNTCNAAFSAQILTDKIIESEKILQSNPFLATRIMAKIEEKGSGIWQKPGFAILKKVLQPAIVTLSLSAAVITGIMVGNLYSTGEKSSSVPEELVYLDDAAIESLSLLVLENNE